MDVNGIMMMRSGSCSSTTTTTTNSTPTQSSSEEVDNMMMDDHEEEEDLRRGPWTVDEDVLLVNYIANHGEGRWNSLAQSAGLKRTGKSCRLRWLNYLRPDVRRGNITPEEQLLILELHSRWGNRWSKIAQYLPGRTDNEIKNYWRTRVQKHAKQLRCDVNSKLFKDTMRYIWMPRLAERSIQAAAAAAAAAVSAETSTTSAASSATTTTTTTHHHLIMNNHPDFKPGCQQGVGVPPAAVSCNSEEDFGGAHINPSFKNCHHHHHHENSTAASSDSFGTTTTTQVISPVSDLTVDHYQYNEAPNIYNTQTAHLNYPESLLTSPSGYINHGFDHHFQGFTSSTAHHEQINNNNNVNWLGRDDDLWDNLWNPEDIWFLQNQL